MNGIETAERPRPTWCVGLALCLALGAGCAEKIEEPKPQAPDMAPLVAAYDAPNVDFTADSAPEIFAATVERIPLLGTFCGWEDLQDLTCDAEGWCAQCDGFDPVLGLLEDLRAQLESGQQSSALVLTPPYATQAQPLAIGSSTFNGNGFLRVQRICDGGHPEAGADADANGLIDLTVGFTDVGLDPVIWGDFLGCRLSLAGQPLRVDAALRLHWDAPDGLELAQLDSVGVLVALDGELTLADAPLDLDLDLRLLAGGALELRVPLDESRHVVFFTAFEEATGQLVQGYRAANGTFTCNFANATCSDADGNTYSL